jgi:hypothetical protein
MHDGEPLAQGAVQLELTGFEGPRDLVLELARRQAVDIAKISHHARRYFIDSKLTMPGMGFMPHVIGFPNQSVRFFPFHSVGSPPYLPHCNIDQDEKE